MVTTWMADVVRELLNPVVTQPYSSLLVLNIFAAITVITIVLHRLSSLLRSRAELHMVARESTSEFYAGADELMRSPHVPEMLKSALYDLILGVTHERYGRVVASVLLAPPDDANPGKHGISLALQSLREERPELADQFSDVVRAAFSAILLSFGHSEHRTLMMLTKSATQKKLVRTAERVEQQFNSQFPELIAA